MENDNTLPADVRRNLRGIVGSVASAVKRGHQIVIWPSGTYSYAISDCDVVALLPRDGDPIYPVTRLRHRTTMREVYRIMRADIDATAESAAWRASYEAEYQAELAARKASYED